MFLADIYGTKEGEEEKDDRQTLQVLGHVMLTMVVMMKLLMVLMLTMKVNIWMTVRLHQGGDPPL